VFSNVPVGQEDWQVVPERKKPVLHDEHTVEVPAHNKQGLSHIKHWFRAVLYHQPSGQFGKQL
jgi:hypothetical protein